jgi:hypothetical protein
VYFVKQDPASERNAKYTLSTLSITKIYIPEQIINIKVGLTYLN